MPYPLHIAEAFEAHRVATTPRLLTREQFAEEHCSDWTPEDDLHLAEANQRALMDHAIELAMESLIMALSHTVPPGFTLTISRHSERDEVVATFTPIRESGISVYERLMADDD